MKMDIDFRLVEVKLELVALEDYLKLLEQQIKHVKTSLKPPIDTLMEEHCLSPDSPEWAEAYEHYDYMNEFLLPCFFRAPFLVTLYSVYEAAVTEIADLIQKKQGQGISLTDIKGSDFLDRAKKYYKHILKFKLYEDCTEWQYITMLSTLRHAFAHTNGRFKMLRKRAKDKIRKWEKDHKGLEIHFDHIIVDETLLQKIFGSVQNSLKKLVERHNQ